jgi:hypothetical protein
LCNMFLFSAGFYHKYDKKSWDIKIWHSIYNDEPPHNLLIDIRKVSKIIIHTALSCVLW